MWYKQVFFVFLRCDCLGIHFYLLGTCIKQQFNICSHSAHQSDFRTSLIWTRIAIATLPISTFISVSQLPGWHTICLLHDLPQNTEIFVSLLIQYNILTSIFLNDSVVWWRANEVLTRATRFVTQSQLVLLSCCTTAFQVRSTNLHSHPFLSFNCLGSAQFADCMTCLTMPRILFQFKQIIAFSLVHTCFRLF